MSVIEYNKLIAYEGHIGQKRGGWCKKFISWKTKQFKSILVAQEKYTASTDKHITCSKGCSFCCSQYIAVSFSECEAIVFWLYKHEDAYKEFLSRFQNWLILTRPHKELIAQVIKAHARLIIQPNDPQNQKLFTEKTIAYDRLNIPCPFLEEGGTCSIYPVRPLNCASPVVTTPPEWCNLLTDEVPFGLFFKNEDLPPSYFYGKAKELVDSLYLPVGMGVHEIIKNGYLYLNDMPLLNGIAKEAFDDPKVRSMYEKVKLSDR